MTILAPRRPPEVALRKACPRSRYRSRASADLDAGQRSVGIAPPADRVAVADGLLACYRGTVEGEPVPALVRDPPAAFGEREPRVLPGHRGHVGQHQLHRPAPGPGAR